MWIESHAALRDHPKAHRLARMLGVSLPQVIGHLHLLWWWAAQYAPDGSLEGYRAEDIAMAAMWEGDAEAFVEALLGCGRDGGAGFLERDEEGRLLLHDWEDYAARRLASQEARKAASKAAHHARWHVRRGIVDPTCPLCCPDPEGEGDANRMRIASSPRMTLRLDPGP